MPQLTEITQFIFGQPLSQMIFYNGFTMADMADPYGLKNTGWGRLWLKNNDRFNSGEPGIGLEIARWVAEKDLSLTGADTWAVEVVPNPDKGLAFPVHGELQTKHGIVNHENLVFDDLIADRKYQFVLIFPPVPVKGATGSNGCPIAVT